MRTLALVVGVAVAAVAAADDKNKDAKHEHPSEGPHHGALAEWGNEEYHVEFTVDHKSQTATVYILDETAKKAKPIDAKSLTLVLKQKPPVTVVLQPKPESGEKAGQSSRFTAKNAAFAKHVAFEGTISGKVGSKPYSGDFKEKAHEHKDEKK
jgi:hypothetical protein